MYEFPLRCNDATSARQLSERGKSCYRGVKSNRAIAQHLAKDLDIHLQTRAVTVNWDASHWIVQTENEARFHGEQLLMTAPIPQSLALLDASAIAISAELRYRLEQVIYQPCIAILALLDQPSSIPEPGGLRLDDPALAWIACNQKKGISPQGVAVTLLATPEFSLDYWETDNAIVAKKLFKVADPWLGARVIDYQIHRWRYSQPTVFYEAAYVSLSQSGPLVLAGDAFLSTQLGDLSSNVERAALSGLEAANFLLGIQ